MLSGPSLYKPLLVDCSMVFVPIARGSSATKCYLSSEGPQKYGARRPEDPHHVKDQTWYMYNKLWYRTILFDVGWTGQDCVRIQANRNTIILIITPDHPNHDDMGDRHAMAPPLRSLNVNSWHPIACYLVPSSPASLASAVHRILLPNSTNKNNNEAAERGARRDHTRG